MRRGSARRQILSRMRRETGRHEPVPQMLHRGIPRHEVLSRVWKQNCLIRPAQRNPARRLRQETTMTLKWMADRLKMGTWTHVANRLYHLKKQICVKTQDRTVYVYDPFAFTDLLMQ